MNENQPNSSSSSSCHTTTRNHDYPSVDFTANHSLLTDPLAQGTANLPRNPKHSHTSIATYGWGFDDHHPESHRSKVDTYVYQTVKEKIHDLYFRYELQFTTHVLFGWEKYVFNTFLAAVTIASSYLAYKGVSHLWIH